MEDLIPCPRPLPRLGVGGCGRAAFRNRTVWQMSPDNHGQPGNGGHLRWHGETAGPSVWTPTSPRPARSGSDGFTPACSG